MEDYIVYICHERTWVRRKALTPWTVARRALPSMEFSRQEYWSGLPCPLQGIFPTQGLNPGLPHCRWNLYHLSYQGSPFEPTVEDHFVTRYILWHQLKVNWDAIDATHSFIHLFTEYLWTEWIWFTIVSLQDQISSVFSFSINKFIFNWRIIALQYCVDFCHISMDKSVLYVQQA